MTCEVGTARVVDPGAESVMLPRRGGQHEVTEPAPQTPPRGDEVVRPLQHVVRVTGLEGPGHSDDVLGRRPAR